MIATIPGMDALKAPVEFLLTLVFYGLQHVPVLGALGFYGLSVVLVAAALKIALMPLGIWQARLSASAAADAARLKPALDKLKRRSAKDPARVRRETIELHRKEGVSPLRPLQAMLPGLAQVPVFLALYQAVTDTVLVATLHAVPSLLWIPNLMATAALAHPVGWILPLVAAASTFAAARYGRPRHADAGSTKLPGVPAGAMALVSTAVTGFFALRVAQVLVLLWVVNNLFTLLQHGITRLF
ncbi:MAG TPA: membrane protein insertase YidC [Candidatus Dormibacteraeota bacterium]|jgi:YidC/Oxa1 family membrane protein insertase